MPPKGKSKETGSLKPKSSSAMRQIDDLIGQSEVQEGEKLSKLSLALQREKLAEVDEKYFNKHNPVVLQRNLKAISDARLVTTIFTGVAAGILGFDGLLGVVFYFAVDIVVALVLLIRFGFSAEPYYQSLKQIMTTGLGSSVMTFMVSWVLFHNLVYIL